MHPRLALCAVHHPYTELTPPEASRFQQCLLRPSLVDPMKHQVRRRRRHTPCLSVDSMEQMTDKEEQ